MEQTTLSADMHPNPNPIPITASTPASSSFSQYTYYPPLPQDANFVAQFYAYTDLSTQTTATSSYPLPHGYYFDPTVQDWAAKFSVEQYGSDPAAYSAVVSVTLPSNGTEQLAVAQIGSTLWTSVTNQPQGNNPWKKRPSKTKVVQSAYCEICKVDCNSKDVLDQHKFGKKHKKNLEKLQAAAAGQSGPPGSSNPVIIGPQENPSNGKTSDAQMSKKAAESIQDLETKRRKIVESGAAVEAVRTCAICNVVCNSETVFTYHLAGQKHKTMVRKHAGGLRVATAT